MGMNSASITLLALLAAAASPSAPARLDPPACTRLTPPAATRAAQEDPSPSPSSGPAVLEAEACSLCHSNTSGAQAMRDAQGRPLSPFNLWSSTMMANSARDPLWRAVVSAEVAMTPSRRVEIESKCLGCHAPMARLIGFEEHETGSLMHSLDCEGRIGSLARDGVSCTICHGIKPDGLGTPATYSGQFALDEQMRLFGPHRDPSPNPMQFNTGFTPTHGEQISSSKLCASCHTLYTHALDAAGEDTGAVLLEQAPYLEWRNSIYSDEVAQPGDSARSCQACHLPTVDVDGREIRTEIARAPNGGDFGFTEKRRPFGRHLLVGANTYMLRMLRDHAEELGVTAHPSFFDATIEATRDQLQKRSARVTLLEAARADGQLEFRVRVENLAGHKLPTAHPIRRVWLRATVRDEAGRVLFRSGAVDASGRLVDQAGEPLPSELAGGPLHAHIDLVTRSSEVATYEAIMADAQGQPTTTLMRGVRWLVDDRILPRGWRAEHAEGPATAPVGTADDPNFVAGSDEVRYRVEAPSAGALSIEVELVHQPLSARWASELFEHDTPEVRRFQRLFEASERAPEVLAHDQLELN